MAFSDWPTSNGVAMVTYAPSEWFLQGAKFWEHGHRLLATIVGMVSSLLLILVFTKTKKEQRPSKTIVGILTAVLLIVGTGIIGLHSMPAGFLEAFMISLGVLLAFSVMQAVRSSRMLRLLWLSIGAFITVCLQGTFGGYTVLHNLPDWTSTTHAVLAELFLSLVIGIAALSSPSWKKLPRNAGLKKSARTLLIVTWSAVAVQFVLGALTRHTDAWGASVTFPEWSAAGFFPSAELLGNMQVTIHFLHRTLAYGIFALAIGSFLSIRNSTSKGSALRKLSASVVVMVLVQATLGAMVLFSYRGEMQTTLHVMGGVIILGLSTLQLIFAMKGSSPQPDYSFIHETNLTTHEGVR